MQPLFNLKSFLAVLLILILSAALLVAYFREYSPEAGGHEHSEAAKAAAAAQGNGKGSHGAMEHDTAPDPQIDQGQAHQHAEMPQASLGQPQGQRGHAAMGHGGMAQASTGQLQSPRGYGLQAAAATSAPSQLPMAMSGARPGLPGESHLYHIGATGFFLDHPEHITLTTDQHAGLSIAKEHALLVKSTADRALAKAEQELWILTAVDRPDAADIEAKVREIEKLRADERLAFICAVGEASKLLTDEQRKGLTGFAPPTPANPMADPDVAMPANGMEKMEPGSHQSHIQK